MDISAIDSWASDHDGLITQQRSGLTKSAWYRAIASGQLNALHPGVARLYGTERSPRQRIHAAVLAAGGRAVASHRSAAYLWDLIDPPHHIDLTVRERRHATLDGVVVHRPTDHLHLGPQLRAGIRCTNVVRTLCDLGAVEPGDVHGAVGRALSLRSVDLTQLEMALRTHSARGRSGLAALRSAVDAWSLDGKPADSILETAMAELARRFRLPELIFHPTILGFEVDFRVADTSVLLECDGWTFHGLDPTTFESDRRRDAELLAAGWVVVRFTYRSVTSHPASTADRIQRVVERRRNDPSPDVGISASTVPESGTIGTENRSGSAGRRRR